MHNLPTHMARSVELEHTHREGWSIMAKFISLF
jgi:hypothetical protein